MKSYYLVPLFSILLIIAIWQCAPDSSESLSMDMASEIAMLPADPGAIGYLNIKSIKNSQFFGFVEENLEENPVYSEEYQEFMDVTGMDIRKDIDEIYFTFEHIEAEADPSIFVIVKGNYQPERIMSFLRENQEKSELQEKKYGEHSIYLIEDEEFAICFADNQRLIAGNESSLENWLQKNTQEQKEKLSESTNQSIQGLKYKKQGWMVMDAQKFVTEMMDEFNHRDSENFQGLKSIQQLNFSMHFDEKMRFHAFGQFEDAEKAGLFRDALKGFIATAKLSMSEDREAIDVLNKIKIDTKKNEVIMQFKMTKEDIDKLREKRKKFAVN